MFRSSTVRTNSHEHRWRRHLTTLLRGELLTGDTRETNNYTEHAREYNPAMAFASMGGEIKSPPGNGPYWFRVHGQIHHLVSEDEENKSGHGQLYEKQ
jgi:hypothetical protein